VTLPGTQAQQQLTSGPQDAESVDVRKVRWSACAIQGGKRLTSRTDTRLQRQRSMKLPEMLSDLPRQCDLGARRIIMESSYWRGTTALDVADGQIPISVC